MIGLDMVLNMSNKDRAQEIWDRAMNDEAREHLFKRAMHTRGKGPDPGKYQGPVVDFVKAARELEEDEPDAHVE